MSRRILIIRLSAIGDIVMASPLIPALRAAHPDGWLAWMVEEGMESLIEAHPQLDEVIIWPRRRWQRLWREDRRNWWREVRAFVRRLRGSRFDLVLDAQGLLKSAAWAWLSGAPRRIGLNSREGSRWLMQQVVHELDDHPGMSSEYRRLAQFLGLSTDDFHPSIALTEADRARVLEMVGSERAARGYAVAAPFTTRPQKHWPQAHWRQWIDLLAEQTGLPTLLLGGPGDRAAAQQISAGCRHAPIDLVGQLTLRQSAAAIASARLLVGVDTGLTHMGAGFRVPTVALFGSTRPYLDAGLPGFRVIYHALACSPCRRHPTCAGRFDCLGGIAPAEVWEAARQVMAEEAAR
ncbi:MAG TPA: lipopolysaccharide heptosyltransferase I [Pseudomonadales bacterium]|jgi:heptosyltransferase-1|nr:lipopolysaccharide heptosyltransferase I [Pseudomonadales bacterium]HMW14361.1 lipopolysaccharide heptosyltransferase I [Pseudomonadales bacterium]HMW82832.1 lipopolysaccharide heptosyltransferase I [Pseudomonadales bacterium]HMY96412.1 lipopolysaccharide heptosyltransferase I [Pseudomonadales bacterium]HMZ70509.1 lipopolysaccharide heptosyltransferase I [Pseudomonadales bacterium]